jgi:hypothetical protein
LTDGGYDETKSAVDFMHDCAVASGGPWRTGQGSGCDSQWTVSCHDCHTKWYAFADGRIPESQWLAGDNLGWNGPWGTTYPVNLRLLANSMSEREWMRTKYVKARPPMPWYALRDMSERDYRDIYRYLRHLGPAGRLAPDFLPPDKTPPEPYVRYPR